jgi:hypothetical protein
MKMKGARTAGVILLAFLLLLPAAPLWAAPQGTSLGLRAGYARNHEEDFSHYEIFASRDLIDVPVPFGRFGLRLQGTAGVLHGPEDDALTASLGPAFSLATPNGKWEIELGSRAGYLSRYRFDQINLGGNFQFISHLGILTRLSPNFGLGYLFQHISNANIYDHNPGLNLHMLQFFVMF